jgi:hypothetical protein
MDVAVFTDRRNASQCVPLAAARIRYASLPRQERTLLYRFGSVHWLSVKTQSVVFWSLVNPGVVNMVWPRPKNDAGQR